MLKTPNESVIFLFFKALGCVKYNFFVRTDFNKFGTKFYKYLPVSGTTYPDVH